jgi:hemerythrin-like metal-binding protein
MHVNWEVEYALGIAEMDAEHYRIIEMIKRLETVKDRPDSFPVVWKVMSDLIDYIETHFKHEEGLMERAGYPGLDGHRGLHRAFDQKVRELRSQASLDASTVHELLQSWLAEHILKVDRDYAQCVQAWLSHRGEEGGLE